MSVKYCPICGKRAIKKDFAMLHNPKGGKKLRTHKKCFELIGHDKKFLVLRERIKAAAGGN